MQTATTDLPPAMPYRVQELAFGTTGRTRPAKVFADGRPCDYLTDDEIGVWEYARHLERDNARLRAELELGAPPPASPAEVMSTEFIADRPGDLRPGSELEPGPALPPAELEPVAVAPSGFVAVAPAGVAPPASAAGVPADPEEAGEPAAKTPLRLAIEAALRTTPAFSNGRIAEPLGASAEMVRKVRKRLEAAGELEPPDAVLGRDGQEQAVSRPPADPA